MLFRSLRHVGHEYSHPGHLCGVAENGVEMQIQVPILAVLLDGLGFARGKDQLCRTAQGHGQGAVHEGVQILADEGFAVSA